ncbi:cilia- and flagella-associated 54 [Labeo rohita]|uniref:Cilia-and flagella-associated 54 n=1 Tax=Labeo rohita TaxID=84645 RepID=A0A498MPF4_LABRO|nr:cilia- and flagella-associated 54 [Labeo rohita]
MDPAPASYYGPLDKNNPVLSAFQIDLKEFKTHIKKLSGLANYDYRLYSRGSIKLFETWNKYKCRLPPAYFEEHLLQTADFLFDSKLYRLALWQGYRHYLQQFCTLSLENIRDVEHFKLSFFPDGFDSKRARLTFRALQGECQCIFYLEKEKGALPDQSGVQKLLSILGFVRILMQAVLPHENLCWIVYNGSLHTYNICRFLMSAGHASQVLEYLLWACTCLETSVPLLAANFLPWRATLYCAVCECYFHDCASVQAEVFARRALGKISELAKLEEMTGSQVSFETQQAYKQATIKTPWPRTPTERILMEMFEGNAARFLAVIEALRDSSVRLLQTGMPEEFEVQDVVLELISAGTSLLSGKSKIAVDAAVKFVKQLFRYEQWSTFSPLSTALLSALADIQPDADLVLDIVLFFWAKCKTVFQRAQSRHYDPVRYLGRMANQEQWVETLLLLCEVAHERQLAEVDFILVTEMTQRLAMVLESSADAPPQSGRKTATTEDSSEESISVRKSASSLFMKFSDNKSSKSNRVPGSSSTSDLSALSIDLHLELLVFQHRLALKISDSWPDEMSLIESKKSHVNRAQASETNRPTGDAAVLEKIKKNNISKCVFLVQKALLAFRKNQMSRETKKILEEAITLMEKAELEERRLGKMVGGAIGETTRPLLASLPLPLLTTWAHIAQVAYQTGLYSIAKRACNELWSHFTLPPNSNPERPEPEQEACLEGLAQTRLRPETLQLSSPLLQQLFFSTVFIQTDIHIQEGALFCDSLCDGGALIWGQEARLAECERMLVAIDLALHLNDSSGALQAVVSCYGLLTPLIFNQIPSEPVIEVLLKCFTVLLEIPEVLKQKRPVATTESLEHMVACMTYYLAKSLHSTQESRMASSVFELGMKLLQEITEASQQPAKKTSSVELDAKKTASIHDEGPNEQLKVLEAIGMKTMHTETSFNKTESDGCELTGQEDPVLLYMVIENSPLQQAFKEVMKFKHKACFLEFVVRLLQKALQEDELDLVLQWKQDILNWLSRRDEDLFGLKKHSGLPGEEFKDFTTSVIEYNTKKQKGGTFWDGRKLQQKKLLIAFKSQNSEREVRAVDILLNQLAAFIRRHQRRWKLRQMRSEDSLWRCHANLSLACAHLGLLRKNVGPPSKLCFSQLSLPFFSLAHCGMLIMWKNVPQHIRPPELTLPHPKAVPHPRRRAHKKEVKHKVKDTNQGEPNTSDEEFNSADSDVEGEEDTHNPKAVGAPVYQTTSQLLDTLNKASVHMRRAMVLAHRWGHWTTLQWACRTLWDQSNTLALLVERGQGPDAHIRRLTIEQLYTVITPLLVLASDLLMDMMEKLKLWNVYDDQDVELEASLYFSAPMDDGTVIDLRWLRTLVLHTLELLYYQAKWENLAHLALLFNTYTRERYSHIVTPVLVHAQRRLLDRISCFGGPPAPQPHFTFTAMISGEKVTCRNYASRQLLFPCGEGRIMITANDAEPEPKELADVKRAMCLVCVPLDVEDTLHCFRETLEKRNHTLLTFQHSRTLLLLLLADTQHSYVEVPFSKETSGVLQGRVEFSMAASTPPGVSPPDLSAEDFSSLGSIYSTTLPPTQIQTVFSSYNNAIKYLQANKFNSLQAQALHDLGNLHFYNGNRRSAHSFWSKALDCALQSSGVLESWDGDSWGSSSFQEILRHAGIWGCLQGALLSAKIAQHILTSNIDQRTKCCLLSAKLFKCLLMASMPHPMTDLSYSTYSVETELIPGIDLFSESDRGNLSTTVASLSFLSHWLYNSGHLLKVLPLLCLYLYIARTVCRDLHLTVTCRILKVKVLTELGAFTQAFKELSSLTFGREIPEPHGGHHRAEKPPWVLDEVINSRPSKDMMALYGSRLTRQLLMARVHLILAICSTIHDPPEKLTPELSESQEKCSGTSCSPDVSSSEESKGLQLSARKLTLGEVKAILLKEAHALLSPELFTPHPLSTDPEEIELAVDIRLLMSNINMQQGRMAASADMSVSALRLLQTSPVFKNDFRPLPPPGPPSSALRRPRAKAHQTSSLDAKSVLSLHSGDVPEEVEARERMDLLFWLRCRLAVVRSLVGHIPGSAICSGADSSAEALRLLKEGLEEAEAWGDPDTKALLLLQAVQLNTNRGRPREDSASMLQLCAIGESIGLKKGGEVELLADLKNIYLPQLLLLAKTTMRIGHSLALQALSSSSEGGEERWRSLIAAQEVLQSALSISQASANRDRQLEADILYCTGVVGRHLISMQKSDPQKVLEAFFGCLTPFNHTLNQSLRLTHRCYLEMALIYLQEFEQIIRTSENLTPALEETSKILLLFAVNNAPLSAMSPIADVAAALQAGQRAICLDRLKAVHALLRTACVEVDGHVSPSTSSASSLSPQEEKERSRTATSTPHQQEVLLEKCTHIYSEIRNLLKPDFNSAPITEMPFDPNMQTLERCFNPATGGTLQDTAIITWLLSLLR